jgi:hypothetical protein
MQSSQNIEAALILTDYQHLACQRLQDIDFAKEASSLNAWAFVKWKVSRQFEECRQRKPARGRVRSRIG